MIAPTATRIENNTDSRANERIRHRIHDRIAQYENASPHELTARLLELDKEWDVERVLELNFSSVVLVGVALVRSQTANGIFCRPWRPVL